MTTWVTLTRAAGDREIDIQVGAIAYLDVSGDGSMLVAFGSGEAVRVAESRAEIRARIREAEMGMAPTLELEAAAGGMDTDELVDARLQELEHQAAAPLPPKRKKL